MYLFLLSYGYTANPAFLYTFTPFNQTTQSLGQSGHCFNFNVSIGKTSGQMFSGCAEVRRCLISLVEHLLEDRMTTLPQLSFHEGTYDLLVEVNP